jgi:hypothetical protein
MVPGFRRATRKRKMRKRYSNISNIMKTKAESAKKVLKNLR